MSLYKKTIFKYDYQSADSLFREGNNAISTALGTDVRAKRVFSTISVKPGFCMSVSTIDPAFMPAYDFEIANAPVQFSFCLAGKMRTVYHHQGKSQPSTFINCRGVNTICSMAHTTGRTEKLSDRPMTAVAIQIDHEVLHTYLKPEMEDYPDSVQRVFMGREQICSCPMTPEMYRAAFQIFNARFTGSAQQLFMESKALELLALQFDRLKRGTGFGQKRSLSDDDIARIREAGDILLKDIKKPPTIATLARLVGINEFKLKRGFKQVFGTTVLGFLQTRRMDIARDLIRRHGADVTQAANTVGYVNVGHFIACYKKAFGITPGEHKRLGTNPPVPLIRQ